MRELAKRTPPQPAPAAEDSARAFALAAAQIAHDHRTTEVVVLDLRGLSSMSDYFVIGTGTSDRQMHAVMEHIAEHARRAGRKAFKVADPASANWILVDYVDVVVHLFDTEHRAYYDLDGLWGEAPRVVWTSAAPRAAEQA